MVDEMNTDIFLAKLSDVVNFLHLLYMYCDDGVCRLTLRFSCDLMLERACLIINEREAKTNTCVYTSNL